MLLKTGCKINLGLSILGKRADGYHNIETVLYPIPYFDIVEVVKSSHFGFSVSGNQIGGSTEDNLCVKAYRLLEDRYSLPPVKIHLHKSIPFGAGLGGGSSDAVAVFKLVNALFKLNINENELVSIAEKLGSDCPFFVKNQPVLATGTGIELRAIDLSLNGFFLVLLKPDINISTSEAYGSIQNYGQEGDVLGAIKQPIIKWKDQLINDFEYSVFKHHPQLIELKSNLYKEGAIYAAMTGSGSALYGIFKTKPNLDWTKRLKLTVMGLSL